MESGMMKRFLRALVMFAAVTLIPAEAANAPAPSPLSASDAATAMPTYVVAAFLVVLVLSYFF
jgi:hypothetical protein